MIELPQIKLTSEQARQPAGFRRVEVVQSITALIRDTRPSTETVTVPVATIPDWWRR